MAEALWSASSLCSEVWSASETISSGSACVCDGEMCVISLRVKWPHQVNVLLPMVICGGVLPHLWHWAVFGESCCGMTSCASCCFHVQQRFCEKLIGICQKCSLANSAHRAVQDSAQGVSYLLMLVSPIFLCDQGALKYVLQVRWLHTALCRLVLKTS